MSRVVSAFSAFALPRSRGLPRTMMRWEAPLTAPSRHPSRLWASTSWPEISVPPSASPLSLATPPAELPSPSAFRPLVPPPEIATRRPDSWCSSAHLVPPACPALSHTCLGLISSGTAWLTCTATLLARGFNKLEVLILWVSGTPRHLFPSYFLLISALPRLPCSKHASIYEY
ncbi:hypothetical protein E2C01_063129 [Portunus trituberculatus]|uniref:Uncharacterized protein n=1 Tax=Portunus trituberculatus TaxID=210409 RepID=A0A5B7HJF7_PORTR|nr:hypothetical protein [Portunus trituberculatus]